MLSRSAESFRTPTGNSEENHNHSLTSRRSFIRNAAVAAAGATIALGTAKTARAQSREEGEITLDAILITYFSATLGAIGSSSWALEGTYSTSLRLSAHDNPDLSLRPKVVGNQERVFIGHHVRQKASTQFNRALMLRHRGFTGTSIGFSSNGTATPDDTQVFGIFRPRIALFGDRNGLKYRFLEAESNFLFTVKSLKEGQLGVNQETVDSWLAQYKTEKAEMLGPRFKLKESTGLTDMGVAFSFHLNESGDRVFSEAKTATTTARIIEQSGFDSEEIKQALAVGNLIDITHSSVQETEARDIISMDTALARRSLGVSEIYWDEVFKNFVVIDAGRS
ncbi:MAG TPA: hypothetical protein VF131_14435 [Blastocatellia bacterium]|nr:hypothetical protein [Blastocatellia bacterium]